MRIAGVGHALFAAMMIALGILGFLQGAFAPVWTPVPKDVPTREVLIYLCAFISLASGLGLLWQRTAASAARLLLASLLLWWLFFRLPPMILAPGLGSFFSACETAVMIAAAWILYHWFAAPWDRQHLGFFSGAKGVRVARVLYGVALVFFGLAHFIDLKDTVALVPDWLPWHVFWAYFFGCAFIAAGIAVLIGVYAALAAALSAVEIGMFTLLVWVPIVAAGTTNPFYRSETVLSCALTAAAWVVADSWHDISPLALRPVCSA